MSKNQRRVVKWLTEHGYKMSSRCPRAHWLFAAYVTKRGHCYFCTASTSTGFLHIEILKRKEIARVLYSEIPD